MKFTFAYALLLGFQGIGGHDVECAGSSGAHPPDDFSFVLLLASRHGRRRIFVQFFFFFFLNRLMKTQRKYKFRNSVETFWWEKFEIELNTGDHHARNNTADV